MSVLMRIVRAVRAEMNKPEIYVVGDEFEQYVRKCLLNKEEYDLVHQFRDYKTNRDDSVKTSKEPDFRFRSRGSGREFLVEVECRSRPTSGLGGILCPA